MRVLKIGVLLGIVFWLPFVSIPRVHSTEQGQIIDASVEARFIDIAQRLAVKVDTTNARTTRRKELVSSLAGPERNLIEVETKEMEATFVADTGEIVQLFNSGYARKIREPARKAKDAGSPLSPTKTAAEIQEISKKIGSLLGVPVRGDLRLSRTLYQPGRGDWWVTWQRYYDGYPFYGESIRFYIADTDGGLTSLWNTVTDNACSTEVKISKEQAVETAMGFFHDLLAREDIASKIVVAEEYEIELLEEETGLYIAYPNNIRMQFVYPDRELTKTEEPRLVYHVTAKFNYIGNADIHAALHGAVVWVDAATGEIVGGL